MKKGRLKHAIHYGMALLFYVSNEVRELNIKASEKGGGSGKTALRGALETNEGGTEKVNEKSYIDSGLRHPLKKKKRETRRKNRLRIGRH